MRIQGNAVTADAFASNEQDVMAMRIQNHRVSPNQVHINLRALRSPVAQTGNHLAKTEVKVIDDRIVLVQVFKENDYYCSSSVVIEIVGGGASVSVANESTVRLSVPSGRSDFIVMMASSATFDPDFDV
jgi:hypothetical protein